jgi:asparagine synthase (glutamine-hydrolysing)
MTIELDTPIRSFTIGFEGAAHSEHVLAREASALLGTTHFEKILKPDAMDLLPRIAGALDEPLGDSSCLPTFLLSEFCRQHVTVSISGDGGDELFGGYKRYGKTLLESTNRWRRLKHLFTHRSSWRPGSRYFEDRLFMFSRERLQMLVGANRADATEALATRWIDELNDSSAHLLDRMRVHDAANYLPGAVLTKVDRMSMAHSLEVRRTFRDREVAGFASRLSGSNCYNDDILKPVLRKLASRYLPKDSIDRPKQGFGLPTDLWARETMLDLCENVSLGREFSLPGLLQKYHDVSISRKMETLCR